MLFRSKIKCKIVKSLGIAGNGLVEVLVALAIISVTMITVVSVTTASLKRIKRDEIKDRAVGIQFRALELAKSPTSNLGLGVLQANQIANYSLGVNSNKFELNRESDSTILDTNNCNEQSRYSVDLQDFGYTESGNNLICNQIKVELIEVKDDVRIYTIKSLLVYNIEGELVFNELVGYRREKQN